MKQHPVFRTVAATMDLPDHVMAVPSGFRCDLLTAVRAKSLLALPEKEQMPPIREGVCHPHV